MTSFKSLISTAAMVCVAAVAHAQVVNIATTGQGSLSYSVGVAIARVMQHNAHIVTRVLPMSGNSAYVPLLNSGQVEFGILSPVDALHAFEGTGLFKGHKTRDLRLVGVMFPIWNGLAVPNDSPVKTIAELRGKRMPSRYPTQGTLNVDVSAQLATGGLTIADTKPFPVANLVKGIRALGSGRVDAALSCFTCAIGKQANVSLASHGGMRFLSLPNTPAARAAMHKVFPFASTKVFKPNPAFVGIHVPTRLIVYHNFLVSSTHVSPEIVYKVLKALHANKAELAATSAVMRGFNPNFMAEKHVVPYQRGAVKFYKEIGQWPPRSR